MRLINTETGVFEEFTEGNLPQYAALSHTWGADEVSFQDLSDGTYAEGLGFEKIKETCRLAAYAEIPYAWIDTCCIKKSSDSELSHAINTMYQWYKQCEVCYVYLSDLDPKDDFATALRKCRWFTRGWTLQELIAPVKVIFFDRSWKPRAEKAEIVELLSEITGIAEGVLHTIVPPSAVSVAEKMSWAARRQTTMVEDLAYCLLGIFDIGMPLLYGEGARSFRRLQEEVIRNTPDLSIFAWRQPHTPQYDFELKKKWESSVRYCGMLAPSPACFYPCIMAGSKNTTNLEEFATTNVGIKTEIRIILSSRGTKMYLFPVEYDRRGMLAMGVAVKKCGPDQYLREDPFTLTTVDSRSGLLVPGPRVQKYLLSDISIISKQPYGGYMSGDDVVAMRGAALQVQTDGRLETKDFWPAPRCDPQHEVFFTSGRHLQDSAFVRIALWSEDNPWGARPPKSQRFDAVCFIVGWTYHEGSERSPQVSIVPMDSDIVTEELLDEVKRREFGSRQLLEHLAVMGVPKCSSARFRVAGKCIVVLYTLSLEEDAKIAHGSFWRLKLRSQTVPEGEVTGGIAREEWARQNFGDDSDDSEDDVYTDDSD